MAVHIATGRKTQVVAVPLPAIPNDPPRPYSLKIPQPQPLLPSWVKLWYWRLCFPQSEFAILIHISVADDAHVYFCTVLSFTPCSLEVELLGGEVSA